MTTATTKGAIDPYADPGTASRTAVKALIMLLITFIMGTLCLQGFNLVFVQIGADVGAADQASLITAIPSIVLGIVSFIYGSLSDFVSLRRMVVFGVLTLFVGSVFGFVVAFIPPVLIFLITRHKPVQDRAFTMLNGSGFNIGCFCFPVVQAFVAVPVPDPRRLDRVPAVPDEVAAWP